MVFIVLCHHHNHHTFSPPPPLPSHNYNHHVFSDKCFVLYLSTATQLKIKCDEQSHQKLTYETVNCSEGKVLCMVLHYIVLYVIWCCNVFIVVYITVAGEGSCDYILCKECNTKAINSSLCKCDSPCLETCSKKEVCTHGGIRITGIAVLYCTVLYCTVLTFFFQLALLLSQWV